MPEKISYESAQELEGAQKESGYSYEDAQALPEKREELPVSYEDAQQVPTFGSALKSSFVDRARETVGGTIEAVGDVLAGQSGFKPDMEPAPYQNPWQSAKDIVGRLVEAVPGQGALGKTIGMASMPTLLAREGAAAVAPLVPGAQGLGEEMQLSGADLGDEAAAAQRLATPGDLNFAQKATLGAINSLGQMLPLAIAGRFGLVRPEFATGVGLGSFGVQAFGQTYHEAKKETGDAGAALSAALTSAGFEVGTEQTAFDALFKGGKHWFKDFLLKEVGGEELTEIAQSLAEKGLYNPAKWSSAGEISYDLALTGVSAGMGAGAIKAVDAGLQRGVEKLKIKTVQEKQLEAELERIAKEQQQALLAAQAGVPPPVANNLEGEKQAAGLEPWSGELTQEEKALAELEQLQLAGRVKAPTVGETAKTDEEKQAHQAFITAVDSVNPLAATRGALAMEAPPVEEEPEEAKDLGGISPLVLERRERLLQEHELPLSQRAITFVGDTRNENALGLTLDQVGEPGPGIVLAVGGREDLYDPGVYGALTKTAQEVVNRLMPNARVVINLSPMSRENLGQMAFYSVRQTPKGLIHFITPRDLPSFKHQGGDALTRVNFLHSFTHELGHLVKVEGLLAPLQGIHPKLKAAVVAGLNGDGLSPEMLEAVRQVSPNTAALVGHWQELRRQVLSGEMTAVDFIEQWAGPRKMAASIAARTRQPSMYEWAERYLGKLEGRTALELVQKVAGQDPQAVEKYLSLSEYMAEQYSRYAYSSKELENSPLGKMFSGLLEQMRNLFRMLKSWSGPNGEKLIEPHTTFVEWLGQMQARAAEQKLGKSHGKVRIPAAVKAAQKAALKTEKTAELTPRVKQIVEPSKPPESQVEVSELEQSTAPDEKTQLVDMLEQLDSVGAFDFDKTGKLYHKLHDMIQRGQTVEARQRLEKMMAKYIEDDKEYTSKVMQRLPNKAKVKAETLKGVIAMQDIKQVERKRWEEFLAAHPDGFSREEAEQALASWVVPLEFGVTKEYADDLVPGLWPDDTYTAHFNGSLGRMKKSVTAVLMAPMEFDYWRGKANEVVNHFAPRNNVVMHMRWRDIGTVRNIFELQSDYFQREDELRLTDGSLAPREVQELNGVWEERGIQEALALAAEHTMPYVRFATADTVGKVEGWPSRTVLEKQLVQAEKELAQIRRAVETVQFNALHEDILLKIISTLQQELAGFPKNQPFQSKYMVIYNRHKQRVEGYLRKKYQAKLVEDTAGNTWLEVPVMPAMGQILNFDEENPFQPMNPEETLIDYAGLAPVDIRDPKTVAQASAMWGRLGVESPYFKRWFGKSQVLGDHGQPLLVHRGAASRVLFLNPDTRGIGTGASDAKKAFFFAQHKTNAAFYADMAFKQRQVVLDPRKGREAQRLNQEMAQAVEEHDRLEEEGEPWNSLRMRQLRQLRRSINLELQTLHANHPVPSQPIVVSYYLRMENPFVKDMQGGIYSEREYSEALDYAANSGFDGVIFKNVLDPSFGDVYAVFNADQAKAIPNVGTFAEGDLLHWDEQKPGELAGKTMDKVLAEIWDTGSREALNYWHRMQDAFVQLQQAAAGQRDDDFLHSLLRKWERGTMLKNSLMRQAEETVKMLNQWSMKAEGWGPARTRELFDFLRAESKGGELWSRLVGKDAVGEVVWGGDVPSTAKGLERVVKWEIVDSLQLRTEMRKHGINPETEAGADFIKKYLAVRNTFVHQFVALRGALRNNVAMTYALTPTLQKSELWEIDQLIMKQLQNPFVPQGNFGKYVLVVKQPVGKDKNGRVKWVPTRRQHFESQAKFQQAQAQAYRLQTAHPDRYKVVTKVLDDQALLGIPLQLPRELLEKLSKTGEFTDAQLQTLEDVMLMGKYAKIEEKYAEIGKHLEGGNDDFARVFADFAWKNSNYIWKLQYRKSMNASINAARAWVRQAERDPMLSSEEKVAVVDRRRRNIRLMQTAVDYVMYPPYEFQNLRGYVTLVYLAGNIKTALMNISTQLNTVAALGTEYGEGAGLKHYAAAWQNARRVLDVAERRLAGESVELTPEEQKAGLENSVWMMQHALESGLIDQSFAYFLAGEANSKPGLASLRKSAIGQVAQKALEMGMWPFQAMEKVNRIITSLAFFNAELEYRQQHKLGMNLEEMYLRAAERTTQTQNAYDAMNRPEIFRGKVAVLTIFMSYVQFMGWFMSGRYEAAVRNQLREEGRHVRSWLGGTTMKMWLIYLLLAGWTGLPGAQNLMDIVRWAWRKFFGTENLELEARKMIKEMGLPVNLVTHGLLHDVGGFNFSSSFGLGRLIPGTDMLNKEFRSAQEVLGAQMGMVSGPAGNLYKQAIEAFGYAVKGEGWNAAKQFPGAIGAFSKATDAYLRQRVKPDQGFGVLMKDGTRLTYDKELGQFRDLTTMELAGMALGAQPTILSEARETAFAISSEKLYWQIRRADIMDRYWQAYRAGDEDGRKELDKTVQEWNAEVPDKDLRITGADKNRSLKQRKKNVLGMERYGAREKGLRDFSKGIRENYAE